MVEILLVRPQESFSPEVSYPLGLLYISSYLKKNGYDVVLKDTNFDELDDETWRRIKNSEIKVVGISMLSYNRSFSYRLIREIKKVNEGTKIVVGGMHATAVSKLLVDTLPIDASVVGEGETTMKELCDYWINGSGDISNIKGIATHECGVHKARELIKDLDSLPFPDWSKVNLDWYKNPHGKSARFGRLIASRGCMGRCNFCNAFIHWRGEVRFRSAKNVLEEIKRLYYDHSMKSMCFNDDCFGQDRKQAMDICQGIIDEDMKIDWYAGMRVDCVDDEMLKLFKDSGCYVLSYGIESGSPKILKNINKGTNREQIRRAFSITKKVGIKAYALLMVGNIGETDKTIEETVKLMNEIKPDVYSTTGGGVWVYPSTSYHYIMKKNGLLSDDYWVKDSDGLPIFTDGFTSEDISRWNKMISSIPKGEV